MSKEIIIEKALSVGFDACGIAQAEALTEDAVFLQTWLDAGMHGDMEFLTRNFEKRTDPRVLVPGCKTVVVVLFNYYPERKQDAALPQISKYAYSQVDYHTVMKAKLRELEIQLQATFGEACVAKDYQHSFVDSAPVLEKRWAQKAGLGWIGRHSQLIHPKFGSYFFIGILMLNIDLEPSEAPFPFRCGSCRKCIDACPTGALTGDGHMDARKCISYLTIESKSDVPDEFKDKLSGCIVGCDICNDVCPWNKRFAQIHNHPELAPTEAIFHLKKEDWESMTEEQYKEIFQKSAVRRAKLERIKKILPDT
ncbi:MAG: tRNA epoxyqueuosine(34) reductase QueG [Paludibacter sp.]|nr:tRNA epoxyqueuosine(34) reductase QueG [Paludibacter sp.]